MKTPFLTLLLTCAPLYALAGSAPESTDQEALQGVWQAQTESLNGHTRKVEYQYTFKGDEFTFRDENGKETKYRFTLETAGNPKLIALKTPDAPADSASVKVAYAVDRDALTIVIAPAGSRPTEMSDRNDQEVIVCKRKRP
jgi:uncharacterized protein (TIGR03067 family)